MDTIDEADLKFKHPFSMLLCGSRRTGKTHFVKTLLLKNTVTPNIDWIFWFSASQQHEIFEELDMKLRNISFVKGLPSEDIVDFVHERAGKKLIVIDDLMEEASKRSDVKHLFTRGRHEDISVIFLSQNTFHQSKHYLEMSRNTDYFVLFKNVRDTSIIKTIGSRMGIVKFLSQAYKDATREPFSYLLMDMRSDTDERIRFRTKVFDEYPVVYTPKESL